MSREFNIERQIEIPASSGVAAQQLFDAVSTPEGVASWLFPAGGRDGETWDGHTVTADESPRHFAVRAESDGWYNSLEHQIEQRADGSLLLRYVHSGIFAADWDQQYDGASHHTDFYLHSLVQYVTHFAGRPVTYISADGPPASGASGSFATLRRALGFVDQPEVGADVRLEVPGIDPVVGVVDYSTPDFLGITTDDALLRFYGRERWGAGTSAAHHYFGESPDADRLRSAWAEWIQGVFEPARA